MNGLNSKIWPSNAQIREGQLFIAGISVTDIQKTYGTPVFVLDELDFRARAAEFRRLIRKIFGESGRVYYASKAFTSIATAKWLEEEGVNLDVCSGGELAIALAANFPPERIELHGNNKSREEIRASISAGLGYIVADSLIEIERINEIAGALGKKQSILLRLTPGVSAPTHESIATAHEDVKFGFSIASGAALSAAISALNSENIFLAGVHSHIGSQIFDESGFVLAVERLVKFIADLKASHGVELSHLDFGGGFGIAYIDSDDPMEIGAVLERIRSALINQCKIYNLQIPNIAIEPGRAISGPSTITLYEVGTVKDVHLEDGKIRKYISVDGGMSDNIRPALYQAEYSALLANRESVAPSQDCRIVGKHCESGDIVIKEIAFPGDVTPGDIIAVAATGAYGRSMASNYNHILRPPVIGVRDGKAMVILRRERIEDLLALEER